METVTDLPGKTARELETLLGIIRSYPTVRSIILFGSTATGTRNGDSDIDLLVIVETVGDFEERKPFPTLERKIAREGKVLYAA